MAYCKNCGTLLAEDARFCSSCGTAVSDTLSHTSIMQKQIPKKKGKGVVIAIALAAVLIVGFLTFTVWNKTNGPLTKTEVYSITKEIVQKEMSTYQALTFCRIDKLSIANDGAYYYVSGWVNTDDSRSILGSTLFSISFKAVKYSQGFGSSVQYYEPMCLLEPPNNSSHIIDTLPPVSEAAPASTEIPSTKPPTGEQSSLTNPSDRKGNFKYTISEDEAKNIAFDIVRKELQYPDKATFSKASVKYFQGIYYVTGSVTDRNVLGGDVERAFVASFVVTNKKNDTVQYADTYIEWK